MLFWGTIGLFLQSKNWLQPHSDPTPRGRSYPLQPRALSPRHFCQLFRRNFTFQLQTWTVLFSQMAGKALHRDQHYFKMECLRISSMSTLFPSLQPSPPPAPAVHSHSLLWLLIHTCRHTCACVFVQTHPVSCLGQNTQDWLPSQGRCG